MSELAEWQAYDEIDPIGGFRMDLNFAMLAYLQASDKEKSIDDFMLIDPNPMTDEQRAEWELEREAQKAREQVQSMIAMFNANTQ